MQLRTYWHMALAMVALTKISGRSTTAANFANYTPGYSFFEMTPENLKASGVNEWYGNWSSNAKANDPDFTKYGEVTYFGMQFLGDGDYQCGIGYSGCNRWPKFGDILQIHPDDIELSRRIHFVVKMQNNINLLLKLIEYGALAARVSAADIVQLVIATFTEQENATSKETCQMLKAAMQSLINMVIDATFSAISSEGLLLEPLLAKFPSYAGKAWLKFEVQEVIRFHNNQITPYTSGLVALDICGSFGGTYEAHNEEHAMQLRLMLDNLVSSFRETLSQTAESLNRGVSYHQDPGAPSELALMMFGSPWINETMIHNALQNPMIMEKHFKTQYTKYLIGTASRSTGCYIKCNSQENAQEVCHETYKGIDKSRFCPRPHKVCQFQCWANWKKGKDLEFHGLDRISRSPFNIDIKKELLINYENYKRYGNRVPTEDPSLSPLEAEVPFSLPVCDSDAGYVHIGNLHRPGFSAVRMFPVSCGDWRSNETREFYRYAAMDKESSRFKQGGLSHFYKKTIPRSLDSSVLKPLDAFLVFCELDISWPQHHSSFFDSRNVMFARNPYCDEIQQNTRDMDPLSANIEFCVGKQRNHLLDDATFIGRGRRKFRGSRHKCHNFVTIELRYEDPVRYPKVLTEWIRFRNFYEYREGW